MTTWSNTHVKTRWKLCNVMKFPSSKPTYDIYNELRKFPVKSFVKCTNEGSEKLTEVYKSALNQFLIPKDSNKKWQS